MPRRLVEHGLSVLVEFNAGVALDPREGVLLPHRDQHVVAFEMNVGFVGRYQLPPSFVVVMGFDLLEGDAGELALVVGEGLGHVVVDDGNPLVHRVFLLPRRGLHLLEARTHDDLDVLAPEPARAAAAVHRRVASAQHDHSLADAIDVAEGDTGEPVDADMNVLRRLPAPRDVEIAAPRRTAADEHGVVLAAAILGKQRLEAVDSRAAAELDTETENIADLFVDDRLWQPELRNLAADHAARVPIRVEHDALIAERREIARHRE